MNSPIRTKGHESPKKEDIATEESSDSRTMEARDQDDLQARNEPSSSPNQDMQSTQTDERRETSADEPKETSNIEQQAQEQEAQGQEQEQESEQLKKGKEEEQEDKGLKESEMETSKEEGQTKTKPSESTTATTSSKKHKKSRSKPSTEYETRLFIDNEFVEAKTGKTFETINPATEEIIAEVQEAGQKDVDLAVEAATRAFDVESPWRTMAGSERRDLMIKLAQLIERDIDKLAELETIDGGKPLGKNGKYGSYSDIQILIQCLKYYAGFADKICGTTVPVTSKNFVYTVREPVGVCAAIIPWNFPLLMLGWKLGPALAAGCTVVVKSSRKTPLSALFIGKLIAEAGFPKGVVNILCGKGKTGEMLGRHENIHKLAFTGSTAVGHDILKYSAESNLKKCTLELGGKSPLIICDDADIEQAVEASQIGIFMNTGQCCSASSRIFVQSGIYDKFIKAAAEKAKQRKLGDPRDENTTDGPIVDDEQFEKIMGYIKKGKEEGAEIVCGGKRHGDVGYFIEPTIFTNVKDDMEIAKEEIFGPVLCCLKFDSLEEAIKRSNCTKYGLAAGICSRDIGKVISVASRLKAGTIWVNTWNSFDAAQPFGGYKESGHGRELGASGLDAYLETKTVIIPVDR